MILYVYLLLLVFSKTLHFALDCCHTGVTRPVRAVTTNKRSSSHSEHMIAVLVVKGRLPHINHRFVSGNVVNSQDCCSVRKPLTDTFIFI